MQRARAESDPCCNSCPTVSPLGLVMYVRDAAWLESAVLLHSVVSESLSELLGKPTPQAVRGKGKAARAALDKDFKNHKSLSTINPKLKGRKKSEVHQHTDRRLTHIYSLASLLHRRCPPFCNLRKLCTRPPHVSAGIMLRASS